MDLNKYTQKSQEAILHAQQIAQDYNHQAIEPAHLLLSLLRQLEVNRVVVVVGTQCTAEFFGVRSFVRLHDNDRRWILLPNRGN